MGDGNRAIGDRKRRRAEWGELGDSAEEGDSGDDVPLDDADVEAVFDILQAKRKEWEVDTPHRGNDFKSSLLGGAWLKATHGRAFDALKGEARIPGAKSW